MRPAPGTATTDPASTEDFTGPGVAECAVVRLRTPAHDPVYRQSVARENIAYNKPPHPNFFIGVGMELPARPDITYTRAE
ncbi:hypothetical protein [Pseudarthrobacter sp. NBSH8]|uniref:rhamnogalacturonan lyase family protein n=1 Tax=Pseudarthrobacter sp. NBSH8 TaxID=2596911 RepID=UPI0016259409|nr:hypothetical protein [Pseudarthrobacter sp. NBSH8]QNE16209.1 hypothetical protein FYJ92_18560 [Pseudarthrobacter sp. NBSH8]